MPAYRDSHNDIYRDGADQQIAIAGRALEGTYRDDHQEPA
jgi:hypothetical protein